MTEILGYCSEPVAKFRLHLLVQASSTLLDKYLKSLTKAKLLTVSEGGMFCMTERGRSIHAILTT